MSPELGDSTCPVPSPTYLFPASAAARVVHWKPGEHGGGGAIPLFPSPFPSHFFPPSFLLLRSSCSARGHDRRLDPRGDGWIYTGGMSHPEIFGFQDVIKIKNNSIIFS
ncbi:hypothetical protein PVAP13_8NG178802 [Panicum virgatum]|uniref:Uncharacterized protein n=1 Tax=Panicum virgatum TaxID=38727 RepID=A0A8T0PC01_PANVG|nr:hypothetical protein PVAP13_8NG178802 [Panicum virgatum]